MEKVMRGEARLVLGAAKGPSGCVAGPWNAFDMTQNLPEGTCG